MITYSVIGTSWITKAFIDGAKKLPELSLSGVYSRTRERGEEFKNEVGAKEVFTSLCDLAKSDCDFVYVASPNSCHFLQCKYLLEHKKNVICEKPVTITAEEFRELFALAEKNGVIYFEAIMYMHTPERKKLLNAVKKLGSITSAHIDYSQLSSKYDALKRGELPNIFNPKMKTGALNDLGIYCVYPVADIFGVPKKIIPAQTILSTGADGCGSAEFMYDSLQVTVTYSKLAESRTSSQILGDRGTLTIEKISQLAGMKLFDNDGNCEVISEYFEKSELMANEARSMVWFLTKPRESREFYLECAEMSERVISLMEKMRTGE